MKKSLIALAVLAVSGAAVAQSSVSIYGVADVVIHKDKGVSAKMTSGGVSTSRIGFKGTEDLGGGLKANFLFEQGVDMTNGAAGNFGREAWVGLSGGFGEVKLGNTYSALDDFSAIADPVFDANVLDPTAIFASRGYSANPGNNIKYTTPSFGGFTAAVSYSLDGSKNDVQSYALGYANGPVAVSIGYQDDSEVGSDKYTVLSGSYDFGMVKLLAGYGRTSAGDDKDYFVGADVPLASNIVLSAGYASSKPAAGARKSSYALGVAYLLSKRTTAYAGFRNDNAAATAAGGVDSRFGVGIKHTF